MADILKLSDGPTNFRTGIAPVSPPSLEERVFKALADAKIWTSKVAMHMSLGDRDRYFRQLDLLHDTREWLGDESPLLLDSYKDFIRFMLLAGSDAKPALGLAPSGNLLAAWQNAGDRLTVEFIGGGRATWAVSRREGLDFERVAGTTALGRIQANIAPYNPDGWLKNG